MEGTNVDYTTSFLVEQTPEETYAAITNPRGWWSEQIEGDTDRIGAEFTYRYGNIHRSVLKMTEAIPGKKAVYHVLDNYFSFTVDKTEWIGTDLIFDISTEAGKTKVSFTHLGLVPEYECFGICSNAWGSYVNGSLRALITTGKGRPNRKKAITRDRSSHDSSIIFSAWEPDR